MQSILIKNSLDELSSVAAELVVRIAFRAIADHGRISIGLSGGSTPRRLHELLASNQYRAKIDWSKIDFFFGDERNVPHDSDQSNYRMAFETLLEPLEIPDSQVHRWQTNLPPMEAAAEYDTQLLEHGPIDLIFLGLGADAHTASLFPHTKAIHETERLGVANWVPKLDDYRLTMTARAINESKYVIFLVSGAEKSEAVRNVIDGESRPSDFPAQLIRPHRGTIHWLIDKAAGALLATTD